MSKDSAMGYLNLILLCLLITILQTLSYFDIKNAEMWSNINHVLCGILISYLIVTIYPKKIQETAWVFIFRNIFVVIFLAVSWEIFQKTLGGQNLFLEQLSDVAYTTVGGLTPLLIILRK